MNFLKFYFIIIFVCASLNASQNGNEFQKDKTNEYFVENVGVYHFKGKQFQAVKLIVKDNELNLKIKFNIMSELLKLCDKFNGKDCLVCIKKENSNEIKYSVSYFSPSRDRSPTMYFYEQVKDYPGYGFGRPIGGVYA